LWTSSENPKTTHKQINLQEPIGIFGVQYHIRPSVRLFIEHQSSVPEKDDDLGFNHAGLKLLLPVEKKINLYAGISVHHPELDQARIKINNPIVILGSETRGETIKAYSEYIAAADDIGNGRLSAGLKYIFK
jgi:hypothetical protein